MSARTASAVLLLAVSAATAIAAERPSFDCASARTARERMVCADPALARADRALAAAFGTALARLDRTAVTALRKDQAAFVRTLDYGFDFELWQKAEPPDRAGIDAEIARLRTAADPRIVDLRREIDERTAVLAAIRPDAPRWNPTWRRNMATLTIAPPEAGRRRVEYAAVDYGWVKNHCSFTATVREVAGALVADTASNTDDTVDGDGDERHTHLEFRRRGALLEAIETLDRTPENDPDRRWACNRQPHVAGVYFPVDAAALARLRPRADPSDSPR